MANPRLNSAHLELPRRDVYRARRDGVLHSPGSGTRAMALANPEAPAGAIVLLDPDTRHPDDAGFQMLAGSTTHPLTPGFNTIGRNRENNIILADKNMHVSRRHAVIVVHSGGRAEIVDLASLNGTFVNGYQVRERAWIRTNDVIRLGSYCSFSVILYENPGN